MKGLLIKFTMQFLFKISLFFLAEANILNSDERLQKYFSDLVIIILKHIQVRSFRKFKQPFQYFMFS